MTKNDMIYSFNLGVARGEATKMPTEDGHINIKKMLLTFMVGCFGDNISADLDFFVEKSVSAWETAEFLETIIQEMVDNNEIFIYTEKGTRYYRAPTARDIVATLDQENES